MSTIDFDFGDLTDEATERAGLDPSALTSRHLNSINRSLRLLFTDIENKGGQAEYRQETLTVALPASYGAVQLPKETIDVSTVAVLSGGAPIPLGRTTRDDYQLLSYPTSTGTPTIFWLSKSQPPESLFQTSTLGGTYYPGLAFNDPRNTQNLFMFPAWPVGGPAQVNGEGPFLVLWPQNGLGATSLTITRVRQIAMPGQFGDQLDVARPWMETIVRGLAAALAEKWNPEIYPKLEAKYKEALLDRDAEENMHPVTIGYRGHGWGRARRH